MRKFTILVIAICLLGLALAACAKVPAALPGTPQTPTSVPADPADTPPAATSGSEPVSTQTPGPAQTPNTAPSPRSVYLIRAALDFKSGHLSVEQRIDYVNDSGVTLFKLVLVLEPARLAENFRLEEAVWAADLKAAEISSPEDGLVHLDLPAPLPDGERIALNLAYTFDLPRRPGKLSHFNNQVHLGDWYAFVPAFRSTEGWLAYRPNPVGEVMVYDLVDFDVQVEILNAPQDLQVAAPVDGNSESGRQAYLAEGFRSFALAISPDYVPQEIQAADVTLYGYALPITGPAGEAALASAASALQVYSELFRRYPHPSFTLVSGNFPDGLEFDGLAFISQDYHFWYPGGLRDYLPLLAAHEVAHQWWLSGVGSDQAIEPWLDEALAIYSELLWLEQAHPELVDWWWEFRVAPFEPLEGYVNDTVYQYGSFRPYVNAVYLRGAEMMHDLRLEMGDEAFFTALRDYAETSWGAEATGESFITLMENHHGGSLSVVWDAYFRP